MKNDINDLQIKDNKFNFSHYPAFKFLLLLLFFIFIFSYFEVNIYYVVISIIVVILALAFKIKKAILYILIALASAILLLFRISLSNSPQIDFVMQDVPAVFIGKVEKIISEKDTFASIIARGNIKSAELSEIKNSNVMITISKKANEKIFFNIGNEIIADLKISPPQKKVLPNDFDGIFYAKYNEIQWFAKSNINKINIRNNSKNLLYYTKDINEKVSNQIDKLFYESYTPILKALIIGNKSELTEETKTTFSNTGTAHVLAVSGLHVGIISSIIILFLNAFENRKIKFAIFFVLILAYIAVTGFSPSVVRAGIMAVFVYFVYAMERRPNMLNILSLALMLMIFVDPLMIYTPSFQMSALSLLGITLLYPILNNNLQRIFFYPKSIIIKRIINSIAITLATSILVSPLVASYFKVYSIVSPLANLIIIPLFSLIMVFAIISLILSVIYFPIGSFYATSVDALLYLALKINEGANWIQIHIPFIDNYEIVISLLISSVIIYLFISNSSQKYIFRSVVSVVAIILIFVIVKNYENPSNVKIYPLKQVVIAEIPLSEDETYFYIADRKIINKPYPLNKVIEYLSIKKQNITVGITGPLGLATVQELQKNKKVNIQILGKRDQKSIEKLFKLNTDFAKYINLDTH